MAELSLRDDLIKKGSSKQGLNPATLAKSTTGIAILAAIALGGLWLYHKILPFLNDIVWGTAQLVGGGIVVALLLGFIFANWRNFGHFNAMIADKIFMGIVRNSPFIMQEKQIKYAQNGLNSRLEKRTIVEGKYQELIRKIKEYENKYENAISAQQIATKNGDKLGQQSAIAAQATAMNYIKQVKPLADNMAFVSTFIKEASQVLKARIAQAWEELKTNKDTYYSVLAGAAALRDAQDAMMGNDAINNDAMKAREMAEQQIALSIGQMRSSMEIIGEITSTAKLNDAAAMLTAKRELEKLNIVDITQYQPSNASFQGIKQISSTDFPI